MPEHTTTNILVVGIGGQGVMTAAEMLARTAMNQGYDVKKTEVAGMAQRGGVVSSHVRFGAKVYSPQIDAGEADLLIGFEAAEALRWLPHLRPTGIAMVNTLRIAPPIVSAGLYTYPADPLAQLRDSGIAVHAFDAGALADQLGNPKLVNTIMLGAISDHLPFPAAVLKDCITEGFRTYKPQLAALNAQAFDAGRTAAQAGNSGRTDSPST